MKELTTRWVCDLCGLAHEEERNSWQETYQLDPYSKLPERLHPPGWIWTGSKLACPRHIVCWVTLPGDATEDDHRLAMASLSEGMLDAVGVGFVKGGVASRDEFAYWNLKPDGT